MNIEELYKYQEQTNKAQLEYNKTLEERLNDYEKRIKALENNDVIIPPKPVKLKAFYSAIGAGANSTGGRGGKVCYVDTLEWNTKIKYDQLTDSYSGGFYNMFYELDIEAKYIFFSVSGTIIVPTYTTLDFSKKTHKGNITVSAHDTKIVFNTSYFQIRDISNLIWRYTSFYNNQKDAKSADALWVTVSSGKVSENIIFSDCSFFYGGDECLSITGAGAFDKVTVQNCLMAASSKGSIIGGYEGTENKLTVANNGYVETAYRFPNIVAYGNSQCDAVNNYVNGYTSRLIRTTGSGKFNVINNYYKPNPSGVNYATQRVQYLSKAPCQIWSSGNVIENRYEAKTPDFEQWQTFAGSDIGENLPMPENAKASKQFDLVGEPFDILDANSLLQEVVPNIGNRKRIDENGSKIKDEYALDSFYKDLIINHVEDEKHNTRYPGNRYPTPNKINVSLSTLKDGIPDKWRLNNMNGQKYNDISPNGYPYIEEYINEIDK